MFKVVLSVCTQALMIQSIAGACIGAGFIAPLELAGPLGAYGACGAYGPATIAASYGGGLEVASVSSYPSGVSVLSENIIEGPLAVAGALPFLGTVALEGILPTAGAGAVNYGCGNGAVAILAEDISPVGLASPLGFGIGGLAGPLRSGCGCGALI